MSNEIEKVLRLVEEGKINAKEGARLIELIKAPKDTKATKERPTNKSLRIKVFEQDSQQINVTIPIRLVQVLLKLGKGIATVIPESNKYITEEDVDAIAEAIEQQVEGEIINITSDEGERFIISIE
ncbi:MAG TPA: hypothetical protein VK037_01450 [Pseudogracilibacillus sp.]|nr:hypothetical protein [Pseudogracilibacillus sp.]